MTLSPIPGSVGYPTYLAIVIYWQCVCLGTLPVSVELCFVYLFVWYSSRILNRANNFVLMLGLTEAIDQLATANSLRWYGHVLRREDVRVMRMALDFVVEGQRKKGRLKRTWKKQVEEESVKVGLRREAVLCQSQWIVGLISLPLV